MEMTVEQLNRDRLSEARDNGNVSVKKRNATEDEAVIANEITLMSYTAPLLAAIAKDIGDLLFGWIPILGAIVTICFSMLIFALLFLKGSHNEYSMIKKAGLMTVATVLESIPLLSLILPMETLVVYFIYKKEKSATEKST